MDNDELALTDFITNGANPIGIPAAFSQRFDLNDHGLWFEWRKTDDKQHINHYVPTPAVNLDPETYEADGGNINPFGINLLNADTNKVDKTLPDGEVRGQRCTVISVDATFSSTLTVTNHTAGDPTTFTFDDVNDMAIFEWMGSQWATIAATAATP